MECLVRRWHRAHSIGFKLIQKRFQYFRTLHDPYLSLRSSLAQGLCCSLNSVLYLISQSNIGRQTITYNRSLPLRSSTTKMRFSSLLALIASIFFAELASTFTFKFFGQLGCRYPLGGEEKYWENLGCQKSHNNGGALGVQVISGDGDNRLGVRFYKSDNCDPTGELV